MPSCRHDGAQRRFIARPDAPTIRNARGVVVWDSEADRKYIAIDTVDNAVPESLPAGRLTVPDITSTGLLRVCELPEGAELAAPVHDAGLRRFRKHCTMSSRFLPGSVADP